MADLMEGARSDGSAERPIPGSGRKRGRPGATTQRAAAAADVAGGGAGENVIDLRPEQIARRIKQLEAEMLRKARNLEFEAAARLRDEIEQLKRAELGLPGARAG